VPVPLGLEVEPPGVVVDDGGVEGMVDGDVVVGGEADGVRSPGRSPTRSEPDSVQAVSRPRLSATAQKPVSILFMREPPLVGLLEPPQGIATEMPPGCALTGCGAKIYQCVESAKGDAAIRGGCTKETYR
jgi:hypothetical protein